MMDRMKLTTLIGAAFGILLGDLLAVGVAHAIVGAPLTPLSVGGVARRTTRRAVVYSSSASASAAASQNAAASQAAAESAAAAEEAAAAANQAAAAANAAAATPAQAPAPAPAPTQMVASLPDGCVSTGEVFQCGTVYYKPYLSGTTVVYAVVAGP